MKNIYVMSDLHGQGTAFFQMLQKIEFSKDDEMIIIGDVGDRGPDGIRLLQYIMNQENITLLMGNHEDMMLSAMEYQDNYHMGNWMINGGGTTFAAFENLTKEEQEECLTYLRNLPLFQTIEINNQTYLLVHAGIIPSKEKKDLSCAEVTRDELLWTRYEFLQSEMVMPYCIIFGHTPTPALHRYATGLSKENIECCKEGKMVHWRNRIAIDCGAAYKKNLGCLRLNDMLEFYVSITN